MEIACFAAREAWHYLALELHDSVKQKVFVTSRQLNSLRPAVPSARAPLLTKDDIANYLDIHAARPCAQIELEARIRDLRRAGGLVDNANALGRFSESLSTTT
jgi:hypothetical protein